MTSVSERGRGRGGTVVRAMPMDPRAKPVPAAWGAAIAEWSATLRAAGRSPNTIRTRIDHIQRCARAMRRGPWRVTTAQLIAWTGGQDWSRETRRSVRASLVGFYRWAERAGYVETSPADDLPAVDAAIPAPRPAPENVYRDALAEADPRARLILRLAAELGLRRAEIAVIHARDLSADLLGDTLRVHGKGGRVRDVPLPDGLAAELRRLAGHGYVFPGRDGGHLSPRYVGKIGSRLLPEGWTLHTLRHRFATRAYAAERDLLSVQTLLGHASPTTTRRYVELPRDAVRRAMLAAAS